MPCIQYNPNIKKIEITVKKGSVTNVLKKYIDISTGEFVEQGDPCLSSLLPCNQNIINTCIEQCTGITELVVENEVMLELSGDTLIASSNCDHDWVVSVNGYKHYQGDFTGNTFSDIIIILEGIDGIEISPTDEICIQLQCGEVISNKICLAATS